MKSLIAGLACAVIGISLSACSTGGAPTTPKPVMPEVSGGGWLIVHPVVEQTVKCNGSGRLEIDPRQLSGFDGPDPVPLNRLNLTVQGRCEEIWVRGDGHTVTIDDAERITIYGARNRIMCKKSCGKVTEEITEGDPDPKNYVFIGQSWNDSGATNREKIVPARITRERPRTEPEEPTAPR